MRGYFFFTNGRGFSDQSNYGFFCNRKFFYPPFYPHFYPPCGRNRCLHCPGPWMDLDRYHEILTAFIRLKKRCRCSGFIGQRRTGSSLPVSSPWSSKTNGSHLRRSVSVSRPGTKRAFFDLLCPDQDILPEQIPAVVLFFVGSSALLHLFCNLLSFGIFADSPKELGLNTILPGPTPFRCGFVPNR